MTQSERYEERKKMAAAVKGGKTCAETSRDFRVSIQTVYRACMEQGVLPLVRESQANKPTPSAA